VAGIIISSYGAGAILGGIVGGKLSDKITPINVSIGSLFVQGTVFLSLIQLNNVNFLIIVIFILGVATYSFITSNNLWVLSQCRDNEIEKLKALNVSSTMSNLGLGLSAVIISIFSGYGFHYIFFFCSVILFLLAVYLLFQKQTSNHLMVSKTNRHEINSNPYVISKKNKQIFLLVLACLFFIGCIVAQISTTYPIYLQASFPQLGIKGFSIVFIINALLVMLFQTPVGNLLSNRNKILMIGVGEFLLGFGMFILSYSFTFWLVIVACVIYTIGEMIFFPMSQLVCYQLALGPKKGHNLGLYRTTYASSRVAGPAIGGAIYHNMGGTMVWYVSGILGLFCLLACLYYKDNI
jgi:predicted MFS family arabinose efflux permease